MQVGDLLRVLPGETVPVDGVITAGQTSINQAVMTGESLPVDKGEGDEVSSGTVNQFGSLRYAGIQGRGGQIDPAHDPAGAVCGCRQGEDRRHCRPLGDLGRGGCADRCGADLADYRRGHPRSNHSCRVLPCALVLATPTAIMAAIGNATRHGFLVREGDALERLAAVSKNHL